MYQNSKALKTQPNHSIRSYALKLGSGCSKDSGCDTVVEHTPRDQKVVGLNPASEQAFSLLFLFPSQQCVFEEVPCTGEAQLISPKTSSAVLD